MNLSTNDIESLLQQAPKPLPPANLKRELIAQVGLSRQPAQKPRTQSFHLRPGWLRRWWPALAPASLSLACGVMVVVQQRQINELRAIHTSATTPAPEVTVPATPPHETEDPSAVPANHEVEAETARLRTLASSLTADIARLKSLQTENEKLREKLAAPAGLNPEEVAALQEAKAKAQSIACINNMKQLGLAARIWANDNDDIYPMEILSMTNEMNTPKILHCPADTNRAEADSWQTYSAANCSYIYLAPGGSTADPTRVLFRCTVHDNIGLCDGSVQSGVAKNHPDWLKQIDGKLYMVAPR